MEFNYSKQAEKFPRKQPESIRNRIRNAWDDIEEEEPDEIDIQMLEAIKNDPDCHEFTNEANIR